jgi:phosphatidylglycerophosphate synthase
VRAKQIYLETRKQPDIFWNAYVCRPVAALLLSLLERTRITPNQITFASLFVALGSASILLATRGHPGLVLGILVFQFSYVLDCADGMLARLRGTASTVGHLIDFLIDEIKAFVVIAAVSVRLALEYHTPWWFFCVGLLGLVALASGVALTTFLRRPEVAGTGKPAERVPRRGLGVLIDALESGAKFLIHYPSYILYAAIIGRMEYYLYPYVVVNVLYAARAFATVLLRYGRA